MCSGSVSKFSFSFPFFSSIFPIKCVTDDGVHAVKTIECNAVFKFKCNFNVFKVVAIIYQKIVAAFASSINTVKRRKPMKLLHLLL